MSGVIVEMLRMCDVCESLDGDGNPVELELELADYIHEWPVLDGYITHVIPELGVSRTSYMVLCEGCASNSPGPIVKVSTVVPGRDIG